MPLLPLPLMVRPDQQGTTTVPDDFSPPPEDRPSPMQIDPIELSGKPKGPMQLDPIVLNGNPHRQLQADPVELKGGPAEDRAAPAPSADQKKPEMDPQFAAYLADRAQQRSDFAAAQKKGDEAAHWADVANGFSKMRDIILQRPTDESAAMARVSNAREAPMKDLAQRNSLDKDALQSAEGQADFQQKLSQNSQIRASLDPSSDVSKRAKMLAVSQGLVSPSFRGDFTASMYDEMLKGASIQEATLHHKATIAQAGAALAENKSRHEEQATHDRNQESIERAKLDLERQKLLRDGARGKPIPASVEQRILAGIGGIRSNYDLKQAQHAAGPLSFGYGNEVEALSPELAAANSPTGRESPLMIKQAESSIPSRFSPAKVADRYFDANHRKFVDRVRSDIDSYAKEGYDVSGLQQQLGEAQKYAGSVPTGPAPTAPTTKTIGGKNYTKLPDGRWVEH